MKSNSGSLPLWGHCVPTIQAKTRPPTPTQLRAVQNPQMKNDFTTAALSKAIRLDIFSFRQQTAFPIPMLAYQHSITVHPREMFSDS